MKDALAYLKAVVNPTDEVSVKRVLNDPKRGIGDTTVGRLDAWAPRPGVPLHRTRCAARRRRGERPAVQGIAAFLELLDESPSSSRGPTAGALLEALLDRSGYLAELQAERTIEAEGRLENLAELVGWRRGLRELDAFLEQVSLVADTDDLDGDDDPGRAHDHPLGQGPRVPRVFIMGLEDGVFPHLRSIGEPDELEEERRLAYVGITRARSASTSPTPGAARSSARTQYNPPSRFLDEIPAAGRGDRAEAAAAAAAPTTAGLGYGSSGAGGGRRQPGPHRRGRARAPGAGGSETGAEAMGTKIGDDVRHAKWGEGVILDIRGRATRRRW